MGLVINHEERDLELPNYQKKLMKSIENDFLNDDNVLALFYGGSIGNENTDLYSDIDLRVVVKPEKIEEYISNKKKRPQRWGNVLYFEDMNPFSIYTVVYYECFIKVDTFYYKPDDIRPSVWLQNIKIIKDKDEIIAGILKRSMTLTYEPSFVEFELWRTKSFAHLHEAYRRVMRNEYYYALNCIDNLRLSMATAWYMNAGVQPNAFGDWAKYEGNRSKLENWQKTLLESWECGRNKNEITNVMKSIVHEFRKVHSSLCDKLDIEENPIWVEKIIGKVI
ncbi:hypothetical protein [Virgibacillus sp. L01]|uniref:hypothetical protein n=1 Tax=Virgibacillus sp. L01 TaxID=3457429 RepID=UPI003FD41CB0